MSIVVGLLGLTFIGGSVLSIVRHSRGVRWRDLTFLLILSSVCAQQVVAGALFQHSHHLSDAEWLAILVIACFLIGIQRAWELIGGPDIGLSGEVIELIRDRQAAADEAVADARSPAELAPPPGETSVESPQRSASPQGS